MRLKIIVGFSLALALVQGCGRKGPLTLPPALPPAAQAQQPAPTESQEPVAPPTEKSQAK